MRGLLVPPYSQKPGVDRLIIAKDRAVSSRPSPEQDSGVTDATPHVAGDLGAGCIADLAAMVQGVQAARNAVSATTAATAPHMLMRFSCTVR